MYEYQITDRFVNTEGKQLTRIRFICADSKEEAQEIYIVEMDAASAVTGTLNIIRIM